VLLLSKFEKDYGPNRLFQSDLKEALEKERYLSSATSKI
jgi:hypothetical protein